MNYFSPSTAAERYAKGRPDFHSNTIAHIKSFLGLNSKIEKALDVACGTGLSSKALLAIAQQVYATDLSQEMLNRAALQDTIHYSLAPAESQPFADESFDLITVSSGVHWFNIDAFLNEAQRLLKTNSWLILYENHFIAEMPGRPDFTNWFREVYLKKYPTPARKNSFEWSNINLAPYKLSLTHEEKFTNTISFNRKQLALYFTTQSNVIAAVETGAATYEDVDAWLDQQLLSFFQDNEPRDIFYGNWIKYINKKSVVKRATGL